MTTLFQARPDRGRIIGALIALASVILPALPLGPLFAQPPLPLAVLWAAYGWASDQSPGWGAPAGLATMGLLHDQLAGGPYGLFAALYLAAFLIGRFMSNVASAPTLFAAWGGFIATCIGVTVIAAVLAPIALGARAQVWTFAEAAAITAILFPLVRKLYMDPALGSR